MFDDNEHQRRWDRGEHGHIWERDDRGYRAVLRFRRAIKRRWTGFRMPGDRDPPYDTLFRAVRMPLALRDGWECTYCGYAFPPYYEREHWTEYQQGMRPTIDHKVPQSKGGSDDLDNLVLACWQCNKEKGAAYSYAEYLEFWRPLRQIGVGWELRSSDAGPSS